MPDTLSSLTTTPAVASTAPGGFSGADLDILDNGGRKSLALLAAIDESRVPTPNIRPGTGRPYRLASVLPGGSEDRDNAASNYDNTDDGEEVGL